MNTKELWFHFFNANQEDKRVFFNTVAKGNQITFMADVDDLLFRPDPRHVSPAESDLIAYTVNTISFRCMSLA